VAGAPPRRARPVAGPASVILFLIDNSASLPPLDPQEKRVEASRDVHFPRGPAYRLILFGARSELFVDDPSRYRNNGQWTDFYFAFDKARELMKTYPEGTEFRLVLLTDGILDPSPREWRDGRAAARSFKPHVTRRTLELLEQMACRST